MNKLKHLISKLSTTQLIELFEFIRDLLRLATVTEYAKKHGHSYNGIDKGKDAPLSTTISNKKFIIDRDE